MANTKISITIGLFVPLYSSGFKFPLRRVDLTWLALAATVLEQINAMSQLQDFNSFIDDGFLVTIEVSFRPRVHVSL